MKRKLMPLLNDKPTKTNQHGYRCTFEGCDLNFPTSASLSEHVGLEHIACTTSVESESLPTTTSSASSTKFSISTASVLKNNFKSPTTGQLMDYIRQINPFEEKFREANNKTLKQSESYSQILSFLNSSSGVVAGVDTLDTGGPSLITTMSDIGFGDYSMLPNLSLKLPETSSLLSSIGLDTPDITNLVSQVARDDTSSSKSAPQTADVLKTVLEMRETVELQEEEKRKKFLETKNQNFDHDSLTLCSNYGSGGSAGDRFNLDPDVRPLIAASPPSLQPFDNNSDAQAQQIPLQMSTTPTSTEIGTDDASICDNQVYISVKINDQTVRIPISIGFAGTRTPSTTTEANFTVSSVPVCMPIAVQKPLIPVKIGTVSSSQPSAVTVVRESTAPAATVYQRNETKPSYLSSDFSSYSQVIMTPSYQADVDDGGLSLLDTKCNNRFSKDSLSPPSQFSNNPEEYKKKETLERNKQAAYRYRKRKKEEMGYLAEKVKALENDKLELSTQVHVLKMELQRVNKILDEHKNCPLKTTSSPSTSREIRISPEQNMDRLSSKAVIVDDESKDHSNAIVSTLNAAQSSNNIVQYIAVPAASVASLNAGGSVTSTGATVGTTPLLFQHIVLPNGQFVVPANTQLPYVLPLIRRSVSSAENINDE